MNTRYENSQQAIVDWFDVVYERKGDRYLRPTRAYYVFLELLQAKPGQRLLDVACGLGRLLEAARTCGVTMNGIDISEVAVSKARLNVPEATIECGNAESLPYRDETFDLVTCIGSLERIVSAKSALSEMLRVGTPNARYCLLVRNSETFSWKIRSSFSSAHYSGHAGADTLQGWSRLLEANGFLIRSVLPDQYPLHVRKQWKSLFLRPIDFRHPLQAPLDNANEFVFLLEKCR